MPDSTALSRAESLIRVVPGYPKPEIDFRDITPLLADAAALRVAVEALVEPFAGEFDLIAGLEARGFLLAAAAATVTNTGLIPIRKAGKLPRPAASVSYALEYAEAVVEIHDDIPAGARVLLMDDVLATGGTLAAGKQLVTKVGGQIAGATVLLELDDLNGRAVVGDVHAVFHV